jgi:hypothetical protein
LGQGRGLDVPEGGIPVDYVGRRYHVVNPGEIDRIVVDGLVDHRLVKVGGPGHEGD